MDLDLLVVLVAALWGAATGALLPRAAYRFSVPAGEAWRERCPQGHPVRGWLGRARCGQCAAGESSSGPRAAGDPASGVRPAGDPSFGPRPAGDPASGPRPAGESSSGPPAEGDPASRSRPEGDPASGPRPAGDPSSGPRPAGEPSPGPGAEGDPASAPRPAGAPPSGPRPAGQGVYGPRTTPLALLTALVCAALAAATGVRPELAVWLLLAPAGVLLAAVDLKVRRLPDPLTLPLAGAALALLGLAALLPEHAGEWTTALLGALALGAGYLLLFLINPAGMGFGDVKLALTAGAVLGWYGWPTLMLGTFAGFLLGAFYGGALLVARRASRKTAIPFGPFLIAGAFLGVLAGAYAA
ncbi:prepilin peptidase [Streptomyces parvulus]|uniref:prepilin peptidase n=1 Tax=Streptomyces parvulus TaxID=146923 RepID=UPI001CF986B9|nr:prepilin peptidase [Streptomyces parvulus]